MNPINIEKLESAIRQLSVAQRTREGFEISMPVAFPDGDFVSVVVAEDGDAFLLHDNSAAAMYLASSGMKSADVKKKFTALVARFGCEMSGDRVQRRATSETIAAAAVMVANASRSVADLALDVRIRPEFDFRRSVAERIEEIVGKRIRFNDEVLGDSGRKYSVRNVILDEALSKPIAYVEAVTNRASVAVQFTEFWDLRIVKSEVQFAAIYDETSDIRVADTKLLEQVSSVAPYRDAATIIAGVLSPKKFH